MRSWPCCPATCARCDGMARATQFIDEADRSLHDAIMIVRRTLKHAEVVPGGGAIEMEVRA
jgi:chaperonin GroEL (HSP60 family)